MMMRSSNPIECAWHWVTQNKVYAIVIALAAWLFLSVDVSINDMNTAKARWQSIVSLFDGESKS